MTTIGPTHYPLDWDTDGDAHYCDAVGYQCRIEREKQADGTFEYVVEIAEYVEVGRTATLAEAKALAESWEG
jgi:hypothetical protein